MSDPPGQSDGTRRRIAAGQGAAQPKVGRRSAAICRRGGRQASCSSECGRAMRPIDSLLGILVQQGGNQLRLIADRRPQMFAGDAELPLTMPAMSADAIQQLLGDLWTTQRNRAGAATVACRSPIAATSSASSRCTCASPRRRSGGQLLLRGSRRADRAAGGRRRRPKARQPSLPPALVALLARAETPGRLRRPPESRPRADRARQRRAGRCSTTRRPATPPPCSRGGRSARRRSIAPSSVPGVGRIRVNVYASAEGVCAAVRLLRREAPRAAPS